MIFIIFILLIVGSALLALWNVLLFMSTNANAQELANHTLREAKIKMKTLEIKFNDDTEALENLTGLLYFWRKLWHNPASSEKKAMKLQNSMDKLEGGNFSGINFLILPGFTAIEKLHITGDLKFYQTMVGTFSDLKGREFAAYDTRHMIASMISYAIFSSALFIILGVFMFASGQDLIGLMFAFGGPVMAPLLSYSLYDGIKSKAKIRKNEIMVDFPQAITEIALLTSSGMELFRAWDEVCRPENRTGPLFVEMRQTIKEIHNGFEPAVAIESFIKRSGTRDTARLGASILQNLTRGNDSLSLFLIELSQEVWAERKNGARALGEQVKSKLMLPMFLIFLGIIILVSVPIILGVSNMGF